MGQHWPSGVGAVLPSEHLSTRQLTAAQSGAGGQRSGQHFPGAVVGTDPLGHVTSGQSTVLLVQLLVSSGHSLRSGQLGHRLGLRGGMTPLGHRTSSHWTVGQGARWFGQRPVSGQQVPGATGARLPSRHRSWLHRAAEQAGGFRTLQRGLSGQQGWPGGASAGLPSGHKRS